MNFSKKQLLSFAAIALVLVVLLSTSTVFSSMAVLKYLDAAKTVNYYVETQTVANTEASAEGEVTEPFTDASGETIIGTTQVTINDAANNSPNATTSQSGNNGGNSATTNKYNNGGNTATTAKKYAKPSTNAEIAAYYKTAITNAKTKAKKATFTYNSTTNYKGYVDAGGNSTLSSIGSFLMNSFLKEKEPNEVHTDNIANVLPPSNATCHLTASDINKATCTDKGSYFFVTILLKPDKNPKNGYGSGSICSIITPKQITDAAGSYINISNIICEYDGAYCEANIDKATGHLTYIYTRLPMYLSLHAQKAIIIDTDAKVGLQFEEKWTIAY